jgi:hypothetical protein
MSAPGLRHYREVRAAGTGHVGQAPPHVSRSIRGTLPQPGDALETPVIRRGGVLPFVLFSWRSAFSQRQASAEQVLRGLVGPGECVAKECIDKDASYSIDFLLLSASPEVAPIEQGDGGSAGADGAVGEVGRCTGEGDGMCATCEGQVVGEEIRNGGRVKLRATPYRERQRETGTEPATERQRQGRRRRRRGERVWDSSRSRMRTQCTLPSPSPAPRHPFPHPHPTHVPGPPFPYQVQSPSKLTARRISCVRAAGFRAAAPS